MNKKVWSYLSLTVLFAYVLAMGLSALWMGDDLYYQYSFATGERITALGQILPSQVEHWFTQNGRFIDHYIVQTMLCLCGQVLFALANAIVYAGFALLLIKACRIPMNDWRYVAIVALMSLLGFQTKFTPTCQVGYIWMFSLIIGYVISFQKFAATSSRWHLLWLVPFSTIAGWSQEALVIGVGAALVIYVIKNLKSLSINQWFMFFSFGAGALLLCLSPATIHRTGSVTGSVEFLSAGAYSIVKLLYYLRMSYLLLAVCIILLVSKRATFRQLIGAEPYLWIIWVVMFVFNILIGVFGNRQLFGMELAALILTVKYLRTYFPSVKFATAAVVILLALFIPKAISNADFLKQDNDYLTLLHKSYSSNPDGTVYVDMPARMVTFKDTYPSDVYTWHVLNTLGRRWKEDEGKDFRTLPTICSRLEGISCNSIIESARGTLDIVLTPEDPRQVTVTRYLRLFGKEIQLSSNPVQNNHPVYADEGHTVYTIYNKVPLTGIKACICE